ncbi:MAG: hypothetical protein ACFFEU_11240 [Candidatus Thorarchaeota archaeon]
MAKETDKTVVKNQHLTCQSSDGEDVDKKDASENKNETQRHGIDVSELDTFWRYYIA